MVRSFNKVRKSRRSGFTLIELLVVVLIVGILLAVALPLYLSSVKTASQRTVAQNIKTIANAAQAYYVKGGATGSNLYPTSSALISGAGKDLEAFPSGPKGVTYSVSGTGGTPTGTGSPCIVTAVENSADDAFDVGTAAAAPGESIFYSLTTQKYYDTLLKAQTGAANTEVTF